MLYPLRVFLVAATAVGALAGAARAQSDGKSLFEQNCSACHQLTGVGIPGAFPALSGDPFVSGQPTTVAAVVLNGRGGMPTFGKDLSNEQIAAILTYVRSAWSNHAGPVTPKMVESVRNPGNAQADASKLQAH